MAMSSTFYHRLVFLFGCFCLLLACSDADTGGDRGGNSDADTGGDSDANRGGDSDANRGGDSDANTAVLTHDRCSGPAQKCNAGTLLPVWQPQENLPTGDRIGRAIIYFLCLCYLFLGVSIISDRFMASIEVITSQEREVTVKKPGGEVFTVTVRIWNDTVSNLTLMALGSSAPEILLSIIEVCSQNFIAGELGPNTIVGSAAFNLFMIIAICVYVIPSDQIRRQNHLRVFFVTASWSIFAYIWLYLILAVISRGVIEVWEGVLTFMFFPITVLTAYIADRKILPHRFLAKRYRTNKKGVLVASEGADVELRAVDGLGPDGYRPVPQDEMDSELRSFEEHRREFMEIFKELRKKHPNAELDALQQMAEYEMLNRGPKSRAFYRVQATRKLIGGGNVIKKKIEKEHHKSLETIAKSDSLQEKFTTRISFDPGHYTVLENVGSFNVTVSREGGSEETTILVDYRSEDGTATAESDYLPVQGTLTFRPGERHQVIKVQVIDDDVFEEDEHFYIHLENLRVKTKDGLVIDPSKLGGVPIAELTTPSTATVMILDDDHAGVFSFGDAAYEVVESAGHVHVTLFRHSGARGKVIIPYKTVNGSAVGGKDFEKKDSELIFDDDETQKTITIGIVDDEEYEKTEDFYIDLGEPIWAKKLSDQNKLIERYLKRQRRKQEKQASGQPLDQLDKDKDSLVSGSIDKDTEEDKIAELGRPRLGDIKRCRIRIKESKEFKSVVDRMIKTANVSLVLGTSSWREQFIEAVTVSAGDDDDNPGEDGELTEDKPEKLPSCGDYVMHFICVPWKILFAFVPPTDYWGGWLCFVASIAMIGLLTAVIGDLASHFGCSIGLKDSVTAISFVALGTSVPDTFASKVAAVQDKYADSSIGNVTGSNAVNVFLGIGIAWSIAAIYHWFAGTPGGFKVDPGTLAFSVTIFCVEALVCIAVMLLRRIPAVGGELGGPNKYKIPTVLLFCGLWMLYLLLSSLESYCIIKGF